MEGINHSAYVIHHNGELKYIIEKMAQVLTIMSFFGFDNNELPW